VEDGVATALEGDWRTSPSGTYLVVERRYGPEYCHGTASLARVLSASDRRWASLALLAGGEPVRRPMFVDLETTGLAGGAGTYAFLVGCAWVDGDRLCVRQLFLSSFTAEAAMLSGVAEAASEADAVVSFNGKSFDMPLLENRFVINRLTSRLTTIPHVDLLHPARRLWRARPGAWAQDCRLQTLERAHCGVEREGDVPGFEIPSRYFSYVRTGNAQPLATVLEHNRLDLISLVVLTARVADLLDIGVAATRTAGEALGLGRLYEQAGMSDAAGRCYAHAAGLDGERGPTADLPTRVEALRAYAILSRRAHRHADAAAAWHRVLETPGCPPKVACEASEALAIHHEHRLRDAAAARRFAVQTLRFRGSAINAEAVQYRLARLDRKLATRSLLQLWR
jgi:uncharacterized protein YprB with RNaseH-like and TPR domain